MSRRYKQGWYKLKNPYKFLKPIDEYMGSFKDGQVNYKSSLEQKAFRYQDTQSNIIQWSVEPFQIPYKKPTTGNIHRYYIDMFLVTPDRKFLVEIKPKSQTQPPRKPQTNSRKSQVNYHKAMIEFQINQAKWKAQKEFQARNDQEFVIFTEDELQ